MKLQVGKSTRRGWIKQVAVTWGAMMLPWWVGETPLVVKTILLISSWQSVNIGDVTHTTGMLRLLEQYLPGAKVILWPREMGNGAEELVRTNYPSVDIVRSPLDPEGLPYDESVRTAFREADFLLHGSSSGVGGRNKIMAWRKLTDKPYGIFGVSLTSLDGIIPEVLTHASFVFTRETQSIQRAREAGINVPILEFVPDTTFSVVDRAEEKAKVFLREHDLNTGEFICVVPRLRYTPYHQMRVVDWDKERIRMVERVNEETAERDHAKLREVIITWVRETGNKVLVCPEMTYQLSILKPLLVDPLPADVKKNVVRRETFWRPDEAASVYARARAVISFEAHSPIIALAAGTPAFHIRQPTDTIKGQMYYDLGLRDWVFEIDETEGEDIAEAVIAAHHDYPAALAKVKKAMNEALALHRRGMEVLSQVLS